MACSRAVTSLPYLLQCGHPDEMEPVLSQPEPLYRIVYRTGVRGRKRTWPGTLAMLRQLRHDHINLRFLRVERV